MTRRCILMVDRAGAQSIWSLMAPIRSMLEAEGYDVHTCRWDDGRGAHEDSPVAGAFDHRIDVPPKRRAWDIINQHRRFAPAFARLLKDICPDVVHTNFVVPGGLAAHLARRAGVARVIATRHEVAASLSPHLRLWTRLTEGAAHHITYVSRHVAKGYGHPHAPIYAGGRPPRHLVIHNGLDEAALSCVAPHPRPPGDRALVVAGRMVAAKGQARALEAFAVAARQDAALRLEFIGDGRERQALEARAAALDLSRRVTFCGWRPRAETLARMKSAHAVLVPSIDEGFGLVLTEAMVLAVPVIASDIPVFHEVAGSGQGVTLVSTDDVAAFSQALLSVTQSAAGGIQTIAPSMASLYSNLYDPQYAVNPPRWPIARDRSDDNAPRY